MDAAHSPAAPDSQETLNTRIAEWRHYVQRRDAIGADVDELESHLRDQIDDLMAGGRLAPDEAFLVAVGRLGRLDDLSREFAREHSDRLWKQLVLPEPARHGRAGLLLALVLAVAGALLIKLPALFGAAPDEVLRNAAVLGLAAPAAYFLIRRSASWAILVTVGASFAAAALVLNLYPFTWGDDTLMLAALHSVVALWLVIGIVYTGGAWRVHGMDFVRFTGEWVAYMALLALGGAVLAGLTVGVFSAVGADATSFVTDWLIPCGAAGAVVIAAWLVEAKQSVIENIAPVLTKVFTPLFTALLLAFIVASGVQLASGALIDGSREILIVFDAVLVIVVGLLLYAISARGSEARPGWFDTLQIVMVCAAIVVDLVVLSAMIGRIGTYGTSPNKLASLGLNLILLINLAGSLGLQLRFVRGRSTLAALERWQTIFLPVLLVWAALVVVVFPPAFAFA
ncbi:permease prefix domain 1-containing protein [Microbacterium sp. NPDC057650]|uniref:permease prefix domain 1-containing protein n=1 Tax=unclassified Microbacterium TaxID=2609290 RepID=UPI0036719EA3